MCLTMSVCVSVCYPFVRYRMVTLPTYFFPCIWLSESVYGFFCCRCCLSLIDIAPFEHKLVIKQSMR